MKSETTHFQKIESVINSLNTKSVSKERRQVLQSLIDYIQSKVNSQREIQLNFICTHNSRRSHLTQIWAQVLASYYRVNGLYCYSGGTEATALFPEVAQTLEKQGFQIEKISDEKNPVYSIKYAENSHPVIGFSKVFDHSFNPKSQFAAIMTCSQADEGCPFISGTEKRIPITYEDPKAFDNTPLQSDKYLERSIQIATEMKFVFSSIKA